MNPVPQSGGVVRGVALTKGRKDKDGYFRLWYQRNGFGIIIGQVGSQDFKPKSKMTFSS
jgi:hypothetical protein